jgi:thiol:disulfide interchange protein
MIRRIEVIVCMIALIAINAAAQIENPVKWSSSVKMTSTKNGEIVITAKIDGGWHVYAMDMPQDGPVSLSVNWDKLDGVKLVGKIMPNKKPIEKDDPNFGMKLRWWESGVSLIQKFTLIKSGYNIEGHIRYMSCNNKKCESPVNEPFSLKKAGDIEPETDEVPSDTVKTEQAVAQDSSVNADTASYNTDQLWAPIKNINSGGGDNGAGISGMDYSFWYIFFAGFLGGLLALLTPCVWPMIPMTVSFFLKQSGTRRKSIRKAVLYGVSIIVIYLALGLLITGIFGASSLNALSTNAIFNIIFFLLLVVFAVSFFGAFDFRLPSSWSNKADSKAESTTGLISIFFMAFTLTLVSFSCTGPIIGLLLVEAASQGNVAGPAVGMFGFALALAIPFTLFALFPSWLKDLPKSGGWLNSVKVVLGFLELAFSLKFLSVADLAYGWGILDREVFVSLWIVIFGLLGAYLLGKIRFSHDAKTEHVGVFRFFLAMISLAFTMYLIPGLWGAPLKSVSAFVPPLYTQDFNLYGGGFVEYDDYDAGMKAAAPTGKPILVDFSGYGCVNCRKMEAAVFDNSKVRKVLEDNYVMIKLMVDDKKMMPKPIFVNENGKQQKLESYGDRWSYLQRYKFTANSQPYYVVLNAKGELISGPYYYDENIDEFIGFLNKGIAAMKDNK